MYFFLRIIIMIILALILFLILFKKQIYKKRIISLLMIITFLSLGGLLCTFPFENLFIDFSSPEDVVKYNSEFPVKDYIYNDDSCLAIGGNDGYESFKIIPKKDEKYKLPSFLEKERIADCLFEYGLLEIYKLKNTADYYLCGGLSFVEEEVNIEVCDGSNPTVRSSEKNDLGYKTVWIYGAVNYSDDFFVIVNGEKVSLASSQS